MGKAVDSPFVVLRLVLMVQTVQLVVDVPEFVQDKFQQSVPRTVEGASLQFIDRVLDISVMPQGQVCTVPNCAEDRDDSTGAVLGQVVVDRCLVVTVQKTASSVEEPQLQFFRQSSTFLLGRRGKSRCTL